jgi:hypothetical protein
VITPLTTRRREILVDAWRECTLTREDVLRAKMVHRSAKARLAKAEDALTLSVVCPYCDAPIDVRCDWGEGINMWPLHGLRREFARAVIQTGEGG